MKIGIYTLGCKVNQYESTAIISALQELGHDAVNIFAPADIYIINTCSVTSEADKKSRQMVTRALKQNPLAKVIIIGCSSENNSEVYKSKNNVIAVSGTGDKTKNVVEAVNRLQKECDKIGSDSGKAVVNSGIVTDSDTQAVIHKRAFYKTKNANDCLETESIGKRLEIDCKTKDTNDCLETESIGKHFETDNKTDDNSRARAYLKVQDGCDNFCSYCIVPYLRGRSRSKSIKEIVDEAERLAKTTEEIVITGINISAFKDKNENLGGLIAAMKDIPARKRLGSLECSVITEDFLKNMLDSGFCDHFHLSLQSGSGRVLKLMNRHYTPEEFYNKVKLIRKVFPYAGITTDVITGFPEETEQEHRETVAFLKQTEFSDIHVFPYSKRNGTNAAKMIQIDKSIIEERASELNTIKLQSKTAFYNKNMGRVLKVFIEDNDGEYNSGYTANYIKVFSKAARHSFSDHKLIEILNINGVKGEITNG